LVLMFAAMADSGSAGTILFKFGVPREIVRRWLLVLVDFSV
jgi:hypothetical protein